MCDCSIRLAVASYIWWEKKVCLGIWKTAVILGGELGQVPGAQNWDRIWVHSLVDWWENWIPDMMISKYGDSVVIKMFRFFKHRLPARKFKNSSATETPVGPGRPSRAWVRTDYNLASVSSKGRKFGVRPVRGKRRTDLSVGCCDLLVNWTINPWKVDQTMNCLKPLTRIW